MAHTRRELFGDHNDAGNHYHRQLLADAIRDADVADLVEADAELDRACLGLDPDEDPDEEDMDDEDEDEDEEEDNEYPSDEDEDELVDALNNLD